MTRRLLVAAVLAYLGFLGVDAPARLWAPLVRRMSGGVVDLKRVVGPWWGGSATIIYKGGTERPVRQRVQWRLRFLPLWRGVLSADVTFKHPWTGSATVSRTWGGWHVARVDMSGAAGAWRGVSPWTMIARPSGAIAIKAEALRVDSDGVHGRVMVQGTDVATRLLPVQPLGSYVLSGAATGDTLRWQLVTLTGPLHANGAGVWAESGHLDGEIVLKAGPGAQALVPLFQDQGTPATGGGRELAVHIMTHPWGPLR